jgi:hypothetical protein
MIDSVLGDASGYRLTTEALEELHQYWFGSVGEPMGKDTLEHPA